MIWTDLPAMNRPIRLFLLLALLVSAGVAHARPPHKKALADYLGPGGAKKLNDCRTCHVAETAGDALATEEKPHNAFGARLKAVRGTLRAAGKKAAIPDRLDAIADEDSDGDGAKNLLELVTGHFPGEASDKPSDAELARGLNALAGLRRQRSATAWNPFEPVRRPALPVVKKGGWVRNPIDAFIAASHESRGLTPRPEAPRAVLLRRIYLDLTGLPPTPDALHAFLADSAPDAYEQVVDQLLASPRYGERWGRHWMDVWRYSDWAGFGEQVRDSQPHIWHWRDWIIESLNRDKGYDRMVVEMLAADELVPDDSSALRATGYLVRNFKLLSREKWMQDVVDHTGQAFLGLTLGCARCHDHMYDPILQKEYYQVRAIFEPHNVRTDRLPGQPDIARGGLPRAFDADPAVKTFLFIRGDDRNPGKDPLAPGVPESLGGSYNPAPINLTRGATAPDLRPFVVADDLAVSAAGVKAARSTLENVRREAARKSPADAVELAELDLELAEARHEALVAITALEALQRTAKPSAAELQLATKAAATAQRKVAAVEAKKNVVLALRARKSAPPAQRAEMDRKVAAAPTPRTRAAAAALRPSSDSVTARPIKVYPSTSTGRRLAFARWIVDRKNPLSARVAVNHVWLRHFGQAIVPSAADFGRNGRAPSHPELLDWLAAELMDRDWSLKELHRFIVTSATYRQASTPDSANLRTDPDNTFVWRMSPRRLEAEAVRDCIFAVAGTLDATMGGADIDHALGLTSPRRSLYFRHAAEKQMEFLKIFDCASVTESYQRSESILPQQALALANSDLALKHARLIARRLADRHANDPAAFTTAAFEQILSRAATADELAACLQFLKEQSHKLRATKAAAHPDGRQPSSDPAQHARENLVHVLLNHHDFVTIR
jgi:hypothetical protein